MKREVSRELVYRSRQPDNLEGPRQVFDASVTPVEAFFVRNHFDVPEIDAESWRLSVEGNVERPRELGVAELDDFEHQTVRATIECAGNSRAHLGERAQGVPWRDRAIGTAEWGGVPLREVLDEVGLGDEVVELIFVGADRGTLETNDGGQLEMSYARSLPRPKATAEEVLIATHMNGEPLEADHGFPARLVVPGWYGMASVKWLSRIIAVDQRFDGYFQTEDYATWVPEHDLVVRRPVGPMAVKSHIGFPIDGQSITAGEAVVLRGYAWGGRGNIEAVEVSVDGGKSYEPADLAGTNHPFAWRAWEYEWVVPDEPGERILCSRARTGDGEVQPDHHDWRRGAYIVNAVRPVKVVITGE